MRNFYLSLLGWSSNTWPRDSTIRISLYILVCCRHIPIVTSARRLRNKGLDDISFNFYGLCSATFVPVLYNKRDRHLSAAWRGFSHQNNRDTIFPWPHWAAWFMCVQSKNPFRKLRTNGKSWLCCSAQLIPRAFYRKSNETYSSPSGRFQKFMHYALFTLHM